MDINRQITRKDFIASSLALTAGILLGGTEKLAEASEVSWPKSPEEATGNTAMHYLFDRTSFEPVQLFDNLFYIGSISVAQIIIRSNKGLIMIDSGWDEKDADYAAESMKKLGLKPADTKYILLTHGHSDHYGGAQFFKDKYASEAKIGMNVIDSNWNSVIPEKGPFGGVRPVLDMELTDRQIIKLGNAEVKMILTPGHTPGCMSMIVPVTANGEKHNAAIWGGTGTPANLEMNYLYLSAVNYFAGFTAEQKVDVELSAHGWVDDTFERIERLKKRKNGEPHPFVIGNKKYREYEQSFARMAKNAINKYSSKSKK